jgi:hypothetical protein
MESDETSYAAGKMSSLGLFLATVTEIVSNIDRRRGVAFNIGQRV